MYIRHPSVADQFYPANPAELRDAIDNCFKHSLGPGKLPLKTSSHSKIIGSVVPHAGYIFSGPVAANAYYELSKNMLPNLIVILGPNHWGTGGSITIFSEGIWETPLGNIAVDSEAANILKNNIKSSRIDNFSHSRDHCIEVQLPFLQYIYGNDFKILPILINEQNKSNSIIIGNNLINLFEKNKMIILASSDLTHYESHQIAGKKDSELIRRIINLDIDEYFQVLKKNSITACGYGAIAALMVVAKGLGSRKGKLLKYATSGDITTDKSSVVGYASIIF